MGVARAGAKKSVIARKKKTQTRRISSPPSTTLVPPAPSNQMDNGANQAVRPPSLPPVIRAKSRKGWAKGARSRVLLPWVHAYAAARLRGWAAERKVLNRVCRRFHFIIPWRTPPGQDPPEPLREYDRKLALEELNKSLSAEEWDEKKEYELSTNRVRHF
jgi:hypothetical protein